MGKKKRLSTKTLVTLGLLTAISIILSRFCVVYITNSIRISFGNIPIIMAGVVFGPFAGGIVGAAADILGSAFLSGYGWYPPLTLSPILMGVIPGIMRSVFMKKVSFSRIIGMVMPANIIASIGCTTYCLHILYGTPFMALFAVRAPLYCAIGVMESFVLFLILKTDYFKEYGLKLVGGKKSEL